MSVCDTSNRARTASIERRCSIDAPISARIAVPRRVVGSKKNLSVLLYTSAQTGLLPSWPAQGPQNSPSSRRRSRTSLPWWIPPVGGRGGVCAGEAQVLLAPVGAADDLRQNRIARTYRTRPLDHGQTEAVDHCRSAAGPTPLLVGPSQTSGEGRRPRRLD